MIATTPGRARPPRLGAVRTATGSIVPIPAAGLGRRTYDRHLVERGLSNYWGYNTIAFLAPDLRYAANGSPAGSVGEFKTMVRGRHAAGLEAILDVVHNHTAEGSELGPTLSLRGIDNSAYYRLPGHGCRVAGRSLAAFRLIPPPDAGETA